LLSLQVSDSENGYLKLLLLEFWADGEYILIKKYPEGEDGKIVEIPIHI